MSPFFYVLIYIFLVHNGLDSGAVLPEPFATQELCQEAGKSLYGLSPHDINKLRRGELNIVMACMRVERP